MQPETKSTNLRIAGPSLSTSLIVTTYNWKEALDLTLRSIARQVVLPDEILIADDGSGPETADLIASWRHTIRNGLLSWLVYQRLHDDQKAIRGCNQGYWRDDLVRVNGFNEEMVGWGAEDNEIAARLYQLGVKRRNLKFGGLAIHLHHATRKQPGPNLNRALLHRTIEQRIHWCPFGLDQHLHHDRAIAM